MKSKYSETNLQKGAWGNHGYLCLSNQFIKKLQTIKMTTAIKYCFI